MIDLSNDRKSVEIQILGFIRKGQIVPYRVLQHYNHILNAQAASSETSGSEVDLTGIETTLGDQADADTEDSLVGLLKRIHVKLGEQKELSDYIVEDSNRTQVVVRTIVDSNTGNITNETLNLDGTTFTGTLTPPLTIPGSDSNQIVSDKFEAISNDSDGTDYNIGDLIEQNKVVDPNGNVLGVSYFNVTQNKSIGTPPQSEINVLNPGLSSDDIQPIINAVESKATLLSSSTDPGNLSQLLRSLWQEQIGSNDEIIATLQSTNAVTITDQSGTINGTTPVNIAADSTAKEIEIQNKSLDDVMYIRLAGASDSTNSFVLSPERVRTISGIKAQSAISLSADAGKTVEYFMEIVK